MKKLSLTNRLLEYLKNHQGTWFNGGFLGDLARNSEQHYKSDTASRRLRELAEAGLIERKEEKTKTVSSVFYRYKTREIEKEVVEIREENGIRVAKIITKTVTV